MILSSDLKSLQKVFLRIDNTLKNPITRRANKVTKAWLSGKGNNKTEGTAKNPITDNTTERAEKWKSNFPNEKASFDFWKFKMPLSEYGRKITRIKSNTKSNS